MRRDDNSAVIRREPADGVRSGQGGVLALLVLAAMVLGTVGFYISVAVAYLMADADMSSAETYRMMFPTREYVILVIVAVTSALAFLVIAKGGLYRAILDEGFVGWAVLCPFGIALLILIRGVIVDLAYYPIHYQQFWSPAVYEYLLSDPLTGGAAYVIDGLWLFAISMLFARGVAVGDRQAGARL